MLPSLKAHKFALPEQGGKRSALLLLEPERKDRIRQVSPTRGFHHLL